MALDVLKGVSCPDHRSTLIDLNQQGWDIEKTSNGHLKLTHAEAEKPVFSGTTVSDFRARKNLISQCRNAIRLSRGTRSESVDTAPMSNADVRKVLASHKSAKKMKKRRIAFDRYNPCAVDRGCSDDMSRMKKNQMRSGTSIPASSTLSNSKSSKTSNLSAHEQAEALFAKKPLSVVPEQARMQAPSRMKDDAATNVPVTATVETSRTEPKDAAHQAASTSPEISVAAQDVQQTPTPKAMKEENALEISTIDRATASIVKPNTARKAAKRPAPKAAPDTAVKSVSSMTQISADVLALAQKIASGNYAQMQITPEMVGATLLFNGEMMMTEVRSDTAPAAIAPMPDPKPGKPETATVQKPETQALDKINAKLVAAIKDFAPEAVTQKDLSELLFEEIGYKSVASALASISARLTRLCSTGLLIEEKKGRLRAFRLAA